MAASSASPRGLCGFDHRGEEDDDDGDGKGSGDELSAAGAVRSPGTFEARKVRKLQKLCVCVCV